MKAYCESLPELPNGWTWTALEDCVGILDGQRIPINAKEREQRKASKSQSELFPYYGATGQVDWIDGFLFDEELVLLGEDGAPFLDPLKAKAYVIRGKSWVNNHAHVLRAYAGLISSLYLFHYLNIFDFHDYVTGTTRLKLNQAPMRKIPLPLAPYNEQVRIGARLEELFARLDAGVEGLRKVKAQLKRYRQAVLKHAFEGKLTEEWRKIHRNDIEPAQKLLEHIQQERRKTRTENESLTSLRVGDLPPLPENWVWTTFGQLLESSQNGVSKRRGAEGKPVHVLRLSDIAEGKIVSASPRDIKLTDGETEKFLLNKDDLLCIRVNGSRNLAGRLIVFDKNGSWAFCDHFIRFRLIKGFVSGYYVSNFFNTEHARNYMESNMVSSAGQNTVSQTTLAGLPVPLAPIEEQSRMIGEIEHRFSLADETEAEVEFSLTKSERLRQSILKTAFDGKLVPQDPSDEPAEKLLERIKAERAKSMGEKDTNRKNKSQLELSTYVK